MYLVIEEQDVKGAVALWLKQVHGIDTTSEQLTWEYRTEGEYDSRERFVAGLKLDRTGLPLKQEETR